MSLFLAERIISALAQSLANMVYHFSERALTDAVANKTDIVF
jgi:hypothetical protein